MGLCGARKLLLVLVVTAYVFSGSAEAWSWSWSSGQSGSSWSWSWGSGGSGWGFGWSSDGTDTSWSWGSPVSQGSGSTHNGYNSGSNNSCSPGSTTNNHTAPSNNPSNHTAPSNQSSNHTAPLDHLSNHTAPPNNSSNHTTPSNHSSATGSTSKEHHKHTVTVWKKGFKYQEWVAKREPFYVNDVLVFKYSHNKMKNNVYLLPDFRSYLRCDVGRGEKLTASSSPRGFKLVLRETGEPYYFTNGVYGCNHNNMKFSITPIPH